MIYAQRIRDIREDRDLTQKQIAFVLQTTQSYYAQYENEHRPLPIDHLMKLCEFYNVSADYFLGYIKLPEPLSNRKNRR